MRTIIFALLATGLGMSALNAQNLVQMQERPLTERDSTELQWLETSRKMTLQDLEAEKKRIEDSEKFKLKIAVDNINKRLEKNEITAEEGKKLKEDAAKTAAMNIDNKLAIVENYKQLAERSNYWTFEYERGSAIELGLGNVIDDRGSFLLGVNYDNRRKDAKYDKRTFADMVVAGGINNVVSSDRSLSDSPYKIMKSGFAELGVAMRTRLLKDSNYLRLAYGASLQLHSFELSGNRYFEVDGDQTLLTPFPHDLKMQKLRITNLVFPVHLEFGKSRKMEYYDRVRYSTVSNFKFGVGGYAGMNLWNNQMLRYYDNGRKIENSIKRSYNASNFVYGLSAYAGFGPLSLYATYDLNPLFKDNPIKENVISLGLRVDL